MKFFKYIIYKEGTIIRLEKNKNNFLLQVGMVQYIFYFFGELKTSLLHYRNFKRLIFIIKFLKIKLSRDFTIF